MIRDYLILCVLLVFIAFGILFSLLKENNPEYKSYQKDYYDLIGVKQYEFEIKQLNFDTGSGILIDRCSTCHMGATNPEAENFSMPYNFHKEIVKNNSEHHNLDKIGCVVCHDGNGRGLGKTDAHGDYHDWYAPILKGKFAQANCTKCHDTITKDLEGATNFNRGKKLFFERACWSCHTISGLSSGKSAPDLSDAGTKFSVSYLMESIVNPTANSSISKMPKFSWVSNKTDVEDLVVFLKGQRSKKLKDNSKAPVEYKRADLDFVSYKASSSSAGSEIFFGKTSEGKKIKGGCINCHSVRNEKGILLGGSNAPELTFVTRSRTKAYIEEQIRNPRKNSPDTIMPSFLDFTRDEMDSLYEFLNSFKFSLSGADQFSAVKIYMTHCSGCHGEKLDGRGPYHALLDPLPRDFSQYQFTQTYKNRFMDSIKNGISGTAMSPWKNVLSEKQIQIVYDYILSSTSDKKDTYKRVEVKLPQLKDKDRKPPYTELVAGDANKGGQTFQKYCTSCHGKLANGKGPNAYFLKHPLPRNLLNSKFMSQSSMNDERLYQSIILGVAGTSMPSHDFLTDQSILDLIEYIKQINPGIK